MTRIQFHRLTTRSACFWMFGTLAGTLAMVAYLYVYGPAEDRPYAPLALLVIAFPVYLGLRARIYLEVTDESVVLVQRRLLRTGRVDLVTASEVFLRGNGGGHAQLVARSDGSKAYASLMMSTIYVQAYQRAEVLEPIIDGIERNRRLQVSHRKALVRLLREQLEHVRAGGPVATAPLVVHAGDLTGVVGAVGAAGAAASLAD
jgi:hypothetical protein